MKRCGLDYWYLVDISVYENIDEYFARHGDRNIYLATTKAPRAYSEADMTGDVAILFGKETADCRRHSGKNTATDAYASR